MSSARFTIEVNSSQEEILAYLLSDEERSSSNSPPVSPSSKNSTQVIVSPFNKRLSVFSTKNRFEETESKDNRESLRASKEMSVDNILNEIAEEHDEWLSDSINSPRPAI